MAVVGVRRSVVVTVTDAMTDTADVMISGIKELMLVVVVAAATEDITDVVTGVTDVVATDPSEISRHTHQMYISS